jgi:hypothetical protein
MSPPIPVESPSAGIEVLTGRWYGEYRVDGTARRTGTILFDLRAGEDHAHGTVIMGEQRLPARSGYQPPPVLPAVLTIRFVQLTGRSVVGELEPYWDAERSCAAWATFQGEINGDRIEGRFTSRTSKTADLTTGVWSVSRRVPR